MPKTVKRQATEYKLPDDVYFPAILSRVTEVEVPYFKKDRQGNRTSERAAFVKWEWVFEITDGEHKGDYAFGETRAEYTTTNDVGQWAEALLGRELQIGEELDTDNLEGLPCVVTVRHDEPRERKDGSLFYPCPVDEVMPRSRGLSNDPPF